jgi:hypothetical protein
MLAKCSIFAAISHDLWRYNIETDFMMIKRRLATDLIFTFICKGLQSLTQTEWLALFNGINSKTNPVNTVKLNTVLSDVASNATAPSGCGSRALPAAMYRFATAEKNASDYTLLTYLHTLYHTITDKYTVSPEIDLMEKVIVK